MRSCDYGMIHSAVRRLMDRAGIPLLVVLNITDRRNQLKCHFKEEYITYCIATLPSILPIAYPSAEGKHETTRVCHFKGDTCV